MTESELAGERIVAEDDCLGGGPPDLHAQGAHHQHRWALATTAPSCMLRRQQLLRQLRHDNWRAVACLETSWRGAWHRGGEQHGEADDATGTLEL